METYLCPAAVLTLLSMVDEGEWGLRGRIVAHVAKEAARREPGALVRLDRRELADKIGGSDGGVAKALVRLEDEQVLEVVHRIGPGGNLGRLQENVARWRGVPFTVDPLEVLWEVAEAIRVDSWRALERANSPINGALYSAPIAPETARSRARQYPPLKGLDGGLMARSRARKQVFDWRAQERANNGANGAPGRDRTTKKERKKPISLSTGGTAVRRALLRAVPDGYVADNQQARIEALVAGGIDVDWAVGFVEASAKRSNAGIPALINNLEDQAAAHLERIQRQAERQAAEEDAAAAWRDDLEQPRWRPEGGFTAPLRPVIDHNGDEPDPSPRAIEEET